MVLLLTLFMKKVANGREIAKGFLGMKMEVFFSGLQNLGMNTKSTKNLA